MNKTAIFATDEGQYTRKPKLIVEAVFKTEDIQTRGRKLEELLVRVIKKSEMNK